MREILYRKKYSLKNRRKMISLNERCEDNDCKTHVRKSFVYIVTRVTEAKEDVVQPQIYIKKQLDTKLQQERFSFRVKGAFYMVRGRHMFKVDFSHSLKIVISWKNKIFSPKKSATLT